MVGGFPSEKILMMMVRRIEEKMNHERLARVIDQAVQRSLRILNAKAEEYSSQEDRLSNFKKAAAVLNCSPEAALLGMLVKHWVSVCELVNNLSQTRTWPREVWEEKLTDSINYLLLLEALLYERYGWE